MNEGPGESGYACAVVDDIVIAVHTHQPPTDGEWATYLEALRTKLAAGFRYSDLRTLVFTDGGAPTARQRGLLNEIKSNEPSPVAIVSNSRIARVVTTAMSWFNPQMRVFSPEQTDDAMAFLKMTEEERARCWQELDRLEAKVQGGQIRSIPRRSAA